jgi:hypothetical protein
MGCCIGVRFHWRSRRVFRSGYHSQVVGMAGGVAVLYEPVGLSLHDSGFPCSPTRLSPNVGIAMCAGSPESRVWGPVGRVGAQPLSRVLPIGAGRERLAAAPTAGFRSSLALLEPGHQPGMACALPVRRADQPVGFSAGGPAARRWITWHVPIHRRSDATYVIL